MTRPYTTIIPKDYDRVVRTGSLAGLFDTAAQADRRVNVVLLRRKISGDFDGLAKAMWMYPGKQDIRSEDMAKKLARVFEQQPGLSRSITDAARRILTDIEDLKPYLNYCHIRKVPVRGYEHESRHPVHDYHADTTGWRLMICYNAPVTEALRQQDVIATDTDSFRMKKGAVPFRFRAGDIWLHSGHARPDTPPFIHRAVINGNRDAAPRLLMVGSPRL